jgi:uncharacterized protein YjbI with pentapeptide repeats
MQGVRERWQRVRDRFWPGLAVLAAAGAAVAAAPSWWRGVAGAALDGLVAGWPALALAAVAVVAGGRSWRTARSARRAARRAGRPARWPWLLSDGGIAVAALIVGGLGIAAMVLVVELASRAAADPVEMAKLRVEAVKFGLGSAAAAGAIVALLVAIRRQRLLEDEHELARKAQEHVETDAAERRGMELYTRVEQLGHAEAAVRLGGMYGLERVGQNNPDQRQTVVNVLCAYLRTPYAPPVDPPPPGAGETGRSAAAELQVRLAAQRILADHLQVPEPVRSGTVPVTAGRPERFWSDIDLDLTGATLVDWDLRRCRVGRARFERATFTGTASFSETTFADDVRFDRATFAGQTWFEEVRFAGLVSFQGATFTDFAKFVNATFDRHAYFDGATVAGDAWFSHATFERNAWFEGVAFAGAARFVGATFRAEAWFGEASFGADARFTNSVFDADVTFEKVDFGGAARFANARFGGAVGFADATFARGAQLDGATAAVRADRQYAWPGGWRPAATGDGAAPAELVTGDERVD